MTNEEFRAEMLRLTGSVTDHVGKVVPIVEKLRAENAELKARVEKLEAQPAPGTVPAPVTSPAGAPSASW